MVDIYNIDYSVWTTTSITNQMAKWSKDITRELKEVIQKVNNLLTDLEKKEYFKRIENLEKELKETKENLLNDKLSSIDSKLDQLLNK